MKIQLPPHLHLARSAAKRSLTCKLTPLALALFCFSATAVEIDSIVQDSVVGDPSVQIGSEAKRVIIGINNSTRSQSKEFSINTQANGRIDVYANTCALQVAYAGNKVTVGSENTAALNLNTQYISGSTATSYVTGVSALFSGKVNLNAKNITIDVNGGLDNEARGLSIGQSEKGYDTVATIGSTNTENLTINAYGNDMSMGVFSLKSDTTLQAKNISINTNGGYGVLVQNNSQDETVPTDTSRLIINGDSTVINAENGSGLMAFSNGYLEVNGNLTVNAVNAIDTRGYATINVNKDKNATVVLNGDIVFETPGPNAASGTIIDSYVNVNLVGSTSSWTGVAYKLYTKEQADKENFTKVEKFKLSLSDGAQWNATLVDTTQAPTGGVMDSAAINELKLDGGIINANEGAKQQIQIDNLLGSGGQINLLATTDGTSVDSASVNIGNATGGTKLIITARGITADDINNADTAMDSLNDKVTFTSTAATKQNVIAEGDVLGTITQEVGADGKASAVKVAENTKLASFKAVNAAAIAAWRDEVAYTQQRLDFLRDDDHPYGVWAQVYGGSSTFDDADLDLKATTVQVGFDTSLGGWVTGVAASYMEGDADMKNGSADVDGYTFALYTERRFDNGIFINGIARYGRLSTDATADTMTASYDNDAFSIGTNAGYRFTFAKYGFIEPSIGLQYAFVKGDDFTSSNGVNVKQDDYNALIGDIGARIGFNFAGNMGKLYARAYLNHDFDGDLDGRAYNDKASATMNVDLGGTWVTYGIGTQMNFTDNFTVFANFDRSSGNEVDTDYMWNAGLRYTF